MLETCFLNGMRIFVASCVYVTSILMVIACEAYFMRMQDSEIFWSHPFTATAIGRTVVDA